MKTNKMNMKMQRQIHQPRISRKMDEKLREVSRMYEQQFLQEMMKAMRSTVEHSNITKPSMAEKIYTDEMYTQYTDKWVKNGGNGLADVIYTELKEKLIPSQTSKYLPSSSAKKVK